MLKISIDVYHLPINRLHHKIWQLLYGLTVVNYTWSKAINLNLRSFILVKHINKIIEVSATCSVQLGTLLILKISVTAFTLRPTCQSDRSTRYKQLFIYLIKWKIGANKIKYVTFVVCYWQGRIQDFKLEGRGGT